MLCRGVLMQYCWLSSRMTSRGGRRSERGAVADVCDNARALVDGHGICACACGLGKLLPKLSTVPLGASGVLWAPWPFYFHLGPQILLES